MTGPAYRKESHTVPRDYFAWEAAGLRWLAEAPGGAAVVGVLDVGPTHLDLDRLVPSAPTAAAAYAFGVGLARTHRAGAPMWGAAPAGWTGDGYLGPLAEPLPLSLRGHGAWGGFYGQERLMPMLALGRDRGVWRPADARLIERLVARLDAGDFDTGDPPSRLHGDLWSGNLVWTASGAVLIDPAAHGGHRETDLAMLALFGVSGWDQIVAGYDSLWPLADGWRDRVALHQVHPLMVHAVLFGGGYAAQALGAARRYASPVSR
jgi:fructosamine-3-kinase